MRRVRAHDIDQLRSAIGPCNRLGFIRQARLAA